MVITVEQLREMAEMFRNPDPKLAKLAEAMHRSQARTPEDHDWMKQWIVGCAKLEATSHQYAHVPRLRRWLAAQLLADEIVAGTSH